jgi:hypothetical protein
MSIIKPADDRVDRDFWRDVKALPYQSPIGVATYQLYLQVLEEYRGILPTDEDWQRWLESASPRDAGEPV